MSLIKDIYSNVSLAAKISAHTLNQYFNNLSDSITDREEWWHPIAGFPYYDTPKAADYYRSYAYAAMNKGGINFSKAEPYLYREQSDGKKIQIFRHPFLELIRTTNINDQSFPEILYNTFIDMKGKGFALWHMVIKNTIFGKMLIDIVPIPTTYVSIKLDEQNKYIKHFEYRGTTTKTIFKPDEVIYFRYPNKANPLFPTAPVSRFNFTLDLDFMQGQFQKNVLKKQGKPGGVLTFPKKLKETEKDGYQQDFDQRYNNPQVPGETVVLGGGVTYTKTEFTAREMDFTKSRLAVRDEIFVILDVPKTVMNVSDDVNYSNSKSALRSFIENNIVPFSDTFIIPKINSFCRRLYGNRFMFQFDYTFKTDRESQISTLKFYSESKKFTDNEIRELEGYSAIVDPRADTIYRQDFIKPIEEDTTDATDTTTSNGDAE